MNPEVLACLRSTTFGRASCYNSALKRKERRTFDWMCHHQTAHTNELFLASWSFWWFAN